MKQSLEDQVHILTVTKIVGEMRASYGWHAARGDFEKIAALYAPDGIFETAAEGGIRRRLNGRDEIRAFLSGNMIPGMVFPFIHNETVIVQGDTAHGTCAMETRSADNKLSLSGYYHDRMKMVDGAWRFAERRYFTYVPRFERSGLDLEGLPETGLAMNHNQETGLPGQ